MIGILRDRVPRAASFALAALSQHTPLARPHFLLFSLRHTALNASTAMDKYQIVQELGRGQNRTAGVAWLEAHARSQSQTVIDCMLV